MTTYVSWFGVIITVIAVGIVLWVLIKVLEQHYMNQNSPKQSDYMKKEGENIPKTSHKNKYMQ